LFSEFNFFSLQEEAFYYGIDGDYAQPFEGNNDVIETGGNNGDIEGVLVPSTPNPFTTEQIIIIQNLFDVGIDSDCFGADIYIDLINYAYRNFGL